MSLSLSHQFVEQIQNNNSYLIVLKKHPSFDALVCAYALTQLFSQLGKQVTILSEDFEFPNSLSFLKSKPSITSSLKTLHKYVISVDLGESQLSEIHYEVKEKTLSIFLSPKETDLPKQDLTLTSSLPSYDAIITIDVQDLESLGSVYADNTDLFYQTPIINIDHIASNELFGQINLVELTCTSNTEVLYDFINAHYPDFIDELMATYLLCGIISKTKSFKNPNITPKSLTIVAQLMAKGAKREEIVASLYQTKNVSTLKLWGRVLARLRHDSEKNIAWSTLTREDFTKSGVNTESHISDVIEEFIANQLSISTIILFYESIKGSIKCIIHSTHLDSMMQKLTTFSPHKNNGYMEIEIKGKSLEDARKNVFDKLG